MDKNMTSMVVNTRKNNHFKSYPKTLLCLMGSQNVCSPKIILSEILSVITDCYEKLKKLDS